MRVLGINTLVPEYFLAEIALQRSEPELVFLIPFDNELHGPVTEIADTIEKDNLLSHLDKFTNYDVKAILTYGLG